MALIALCTLISGPPLKGWQSIGVTKRIYFSFVFQEIESKKLLDFLDII